MSQLSKSRRSARNSARNIRRIGQLSNGGYNRQPKKIKPFPTFLEYALTVGDRMIVGDIVDMLPDHLNKPHKHNLMHNEIFKNIIVEKVGLIYSPKKKLFMWIGLNDNNTGFILYKDAKLSNLPNIKNIDIEKLKGSMQVIENINRLITSVYLYLDDLCYNPVCRYKITELFKR